MTNTFLDTARRVIRIETEALASLEAGLDDSFSNAVELMLKATGRVIVSGMGKSGHIGRKIAATLASTGTPAHFVYPAEASHGDLGMMGEGDVVIVLSNSGETPELADVIAYTRRFSIPMLTRQFQREAVRQFCRQLAAVLSPAAFFYLRKSDLRIDNAGDQR